MRLGLSSLAGASLAICFSACTTIRSQTNSNSRVEDEVPTITACKLVENAERFDQKVVRVIGIYDNGFERSYLYDLDCNIGDRGRQPVWVGRDKSFVVKGETDEAKMNRTISGFGRWRVTVVGRFVRAKAPGRFGRMGCCQYEFDFMRIEKSEQLPARKTN
jgi:hypothetical protein